MKMTFWLALMATMICSTKTLQAQNLRIYESDGNAVSYNYNQIDSLVFNVAADETEPVVVNVLGQNPWKGKRVGVLGDSISDGVHVGTEKCWWEFMSEWLGLVTTCFAQNGANISGMLTQAQQLLKVQREEGKAFDAVIIFGGTNDYNQGCTLLGKNILYCRQCGPDTCVILHHTFFQRNVEINPDKNSFSCQVCIADCI